MFTFIFISLLVGAVYGLYRATHRKEVFDFSKVTMDSIKPYMPPDEGAGEWTNELVILGSSTTTKRGPELFFERD